MLSLREKILVAVLVIVMIGTGTIAFLSYQKGQEIKAWCDSHNGVVVETKDGVLLCAPRRAML